MNIENVISFIYLYRLGNYSKAAEALYISQPSLTSRIKTLEKDFGTTLLIRNKKGVELTENGKSFLPHALQMVDGYNKAKRSLRKTDEKITIGSIISVSTSFLPNAVHELQKKNPNLSIKVVTAKSKTLLERLLNNECQIAITEKIEHPDIVCEPIYQDSISLFVNPSHYFVKRNGNITLEEAAFEPLICFNPNSSYWVKIEEHFQQRNLTPNIVFNIDSIEAAKSAIINGIGICFLPELSLESMVSNGQLCKININPSININRELCIVHLKENTPHLQEFKNNLHETLRG